MRHISSVQATAAANVALKRQRWFHGSADAVHVSRGCQIDGATARQRIQLCTYSYRPGCELGSLPRRGGRAAATNRTRSWPSADTAAPAAEKSDEQCMR